ncbi:MAG: hypothetical protein U0271_08895 [Polyangiaceae bacterium]
MNATHKLGSLLGLITCLTFGCESSSTQASRVASDEPAKDTSSAIAPATSAPVSSAPVALHSSAPGTPPPASAIPLLDLASLPKTAKAMNGKRVRVVGETFQGAFVLQFENGEVASFEVKTQVCTLALCLPDHPCCNRCGSAVSLKGPELMGVRLVSGDENNPRFGCGGDSCSLTCSPAEGRYEAIGIFRLGSNGELDLVVESLSPA